MRSVTLQVRNEKIKADDAVRQEAEGKLDLHRRSAARSLDEQLTGVMIGRRVEGRKGRRWGSLRRCGMMVQRSGVIYSNLQIYTHTQIIQRTNIYMLRVSIFNYNQQLFPKIRPSSSSSVRRSAAQLLLLLLTCL